MISEQLAREATNSPALKLEGFDEFVGVGVVPKHARSKDMVVAVYVSRPSKSLSKAFRANVPSVVEVSSNGRPVHVRTKIVNIGALEF